MGVWGGILIDAFTRRFKFFNSEVSLTFSVRFLSASWDLSRCHTEKGWTWIHSCVCAVVQLDPAGAVGARMWPDLSHFPAVPLGVSLQDRCRLMVGPSSIPSSPWPHTWERTGKGCVVKHQWHGTLNISKTHRSEWDWSPALGVSKIVTMSSLWDVLLPSQLFLMGISNDKKLTLYIEI